MKKRRVAVIYGGKGKEHDVSKMSAAFLLSVIDRERYIPIPVYISQDGGWYLGEDGDGSVTLSPEGGRFLANGEDLGIEVAFPILHGDYGEDGSVQGALECLGVPYVGCRVTSGAVLTDKILTKALADSIGVPTVPSLFFDGRTDIECFAANAESRIGYPMFVKPATLGSSIGAAKVCDRSELLRAIDVCLALGDRGLVEVYIDNRREIEVGYLGCSDGDVITEGGEVITDGWYDYDEKYSEASGARVLDRTELSDSTRVKLKDYTRRLVHLFGIRQISRLDYFLVGQDIYLNEINTMPGFTEASLYPRLIGRCGISPCELVTRLIEGALVL